MAGFINQFLQALGTGPGLRDYQHGQKTFIDSLYRLSPKYSSLFHVFMDLNPAASNQDQTSQIEIGLMAKTVNLPKFTIRTKTYNAYNRKNIAQEKIEYDPITLTFHDDSADVVRNFWYDYYSYYYRDSDHSEAIYAAPHKYQQRQQQNFGYSIRNMNSVDDYLTAIRIYSLHQGEFSAYTLINPKVTTFQHGEHTQGSNEVMQHSMTVAYESVLYSYGPVSSGTVQGFNVVHYDKSPSPLTPLGGGTRSFLGKGGLVNSASDIITNLGEGNFGAAGLTALRTYNNFKNQDLKSIASAEGLQAVKNVLNGRPSQSNFFFPGSSSIFKK